METKEHVSERNSLLGKFRTSRRKRARYEYIRCYIVRRIPRVIKRIKQIWNDEAKLNAFCLTHSGSRILIESLRGNTELCANLSLYARHPDQHPVCPAKTYNNKFLKAFFKGKEPKVLLELLLDQMFSNTAPEDLCQEFHMWCCSSSHSDACQSLWYQFKRWIYEKMPAELGFQLDPIIEDPDDLLSVEPH